MVQAASGGLQSMKPVLHHRAGMPVQRYEALFELREADCPPQGAGYRLWYDAAGMALCKGSDRRGFRLRYRDIAARAGQSLLLAQASAARRRPAVADLTAGWGTDGLCLALRGCQLWLIERAPVVWAMLDEFVLRLGLPAKVVWASAEDWCQAHPDSVDVALLDPMFPKQRKTALPEKSMQLLRDLAWHDGAGLARQISWALLAARKRVLVKRRIRDRAEPAPDWQVRGRRIRFDVYSAAGGRIQMAGAAQSPSRAG